MSFDIMTIMILSLLLNFIGAGAMAIIWQLSRKRFDGTFLWFVSMVLQVAGNGLTILRGTLPDLFTIVLSNILMIGGFLTLNIGLCKFVSRKVSQIHNFILLAVSALLLYYFSMIRPDINARIAVFSAMIIIINFQICWLLLLKAPPDLRRITRITAVVLSGYIAVSIGRIVFLFVFPLKTSDFFNSGIVESLSLTLYMAVSCCLMISLILLVNKRLLQQVKSQEDKYTILFHSSPSAITLTRLSDGAIFEVNDGFTRTTGYSFEDVIGKSTFELEFWANVEDRTAVVEELLKNHKVEGIEVKFRKKSGESFFGLYTADTLVINNEECILATISDITEISRMKYELQVKATHDELTGLPNRILFYDRFGSAVASARRNNNEFAVMSVDVDKFKLINDNLGHVVGDKVLIAVAERFSRFLREVDTVARFGGDEFVLLFGEIENRDDARRIAEKIQDEFRQPFIIDDQTITLTVSIGIALYPADSADMNDLIKKSDESLYFIKEHGRNGYQFFDRLASV